MKLHRKRANHSSAVQQLFSSAATLYFRTKRPSKLIKDLIRPVEYHPWTEDHEIFLTGGPSYSTAGPFLRHLLFSPGPNLTVSGTLSVLGSQAQGEICSAY